MSKNPFVFSNFTNNSEIFFTIFGSKKFNWEFHEYFPNFNGRTPQTKKLRLINQLDSNKKAADYLEKVLTKIKSSIASLHSSLPRESFIQNDHIKKKKLIKKLYFLKPSKCWKLNCKVVKPEMLQYVTTKLETQSLDASIRIRHSQNQEQAEVRVLNQVRRLIYFYFQKMVVKTLVVNFPELYIF